MSSPRFTVPPVLLTLFAAALMRLLARATPPLRTSIPLHGELTLLFAIAGTVSVALAAAAFIRAHTTTSPMQPQRASALVTTGIFRVTRNPMYLGLLLLLGGWAIYLANPLAGLVLPIFVLYLNRFQIAAEEAALTRNFGGTYTAYQHRVRRWL
jgi:protein-S-isoprenylcysteine O-methyltransferase Ste14